MSDEQQTTQHEALADLTGHHSTLRRAVANDAAAADALYTIMQALISERMQVMRLEADNRLLKYRVERQKAHITNTEGYLGDRNSRIVELERELAKVRKQLEGYESAPDHGSRRNVPEMFGASVANLLGADFTVDRLLALSHDLKLGVNYGSNGERAAIRAAVDEYQRLVKLNPQRFSASR